MSNNDDKLKELMKQATETPDESYDGEGSSDSGAPKKVILFSLVGLLLLGGAFFFGSMFMSKQDEFEDKTKDPDWVGKEKEVEEVDTSEEWDSQHPIELPSWATEKYNESEFWEKDDIDNQILMRVGQYKGFYNSIAWLDSGVKFEYDGKGEDVFPDPKTNDISKRYLENGDDNPDFSYALREDYQEAFVVGVERLLNPVFGGWAQVQIDADESSIEARLSGLKDIFSNDWWESNIENGSYNNLPILVEWNEGDWGKYKLSDRNTEKFAYFYGELIDNTVEENILSEIVGYDDEGQPIIEVEAPVKYSAFDKKGEIVTIHGKLELTLHSNQDNLDVLERVIIDKAKLTLEE